MNTNIKNILKVVLGAILTLLGISIIWAGYLSLRYSPTYVVREWFMHLGTPYDYRTFPERQLNASSNPYQFAFDNNKEALVQQTFQTYPKIEALDSFLAKTGTQAFLVVQDDTIVYEGYFMGYQRDSIVTSFSVAKSFTSALIGIAIHEGHIESVEDPITNYLPELIQRDPRFKDIQIKHLLMMASGLRYEPDRPNSLGDDSLTYAFDDLRHLALTETEIVEPPGLTFVYNNYNPLLLGMILERATKTSVTDYLQQKLWTPLGMEYDGSWSLDSEKTAFEKMESGINARAIDFAKFGNLYLHRGNWYGQQLVPVEWVALTTQDNGLLSPGLIFYGYMWWGTRCSSEYQDFTALGNFGQYIYVSPTKNLVIVRNGERYGIEEEFEWLDIFCQFARDLK